MDGQVIQQLEKYDSRLGKLEAQQDAAGGVTSVSVTSPITNSGTSTAPNIGLATSGVSAGSYTNGSFTVLADGRLSAASSGSTPVTSVGATAPIASSGGATPTISIAITPASNGGAVALQGSTPGTQQTGNANFSGKLITGGDVAAVGNVSGVNVTGSGTVQGATVTSTGAVNATTTINRAGIAMNNVTVLNQICRVLDDSTSRASGYANSAVQVSGATDLAGSGVTLPATLKACWFTFFILTAAATGIGVVVENPSFVVGASTMRGTTVQQSGGGNFAYSGGGVVSLDASGRLRFVYSGTANSTRIIVDIWAYSV